MFSIPPGCRAVEDAESFVVLCQRHFARRPRCDSVLSFSLVECDGCSECRLDCLSCGGASGESA
jgi:hypothetical protein